MVLKPMATDAKEPTFSMGDDIAVRHRVGRRPRPVFHFLKQRFAQVTNPPIDHLRERLVMSLRTLPRAAPAAAQRGPGRGPAARAADVLRVPVGGRRRCSTRPRRRSRPARLDATFPVGRGPGRPRATRSSALGRRRRASASRGGVGVLVDLRRAASTPDRAPIPSLLATGAVHHRLVASAPPPGRVARGRQRRRARRPRRRRACSATAPTRSARGSRSRPSPRWPTTDELGELARGRGAGQAPGRARGRRAEDHVEDGDLDRRRLPRRADLRGARPRRRGGRPVPRRHDRPTVGGLGFDALGDDVLARHAAGYVVDEVGARRARAHPVPQARRRVPRATTRRSSRRCTASPGRRRATATRRRRSSSTRCRSRRPATRAE